MDLVTINAIALVVLVLITGWYAFSTMQIVQQVRRQTSALEKQTAATEESVALLRQTTEEQRGIGRTIVASTLQSALRSIEYWRNENIVNLAYVRALPSRVMLVPETGRRAVEHARLISPEGSVELASALDHLRRCEELFQITHGLIGRPGHEIQHQVARILTTLEMAEQDIRRAEELLRGLREGAITPE